jgi:hypothetical protein
MGDQKTVLKNADIGETVVGQDIYRESATATCRLGTRLVLGDRVFRYCKNAAAASVTVGNLIQAPAAEVTSAYEEDVVVPTTSPAGSRTVYLTNTTGHSTLAANGLKDGYIVIGAGAGLGTCMKVKSNTAAVAGALCTVTLYDPLPVAITAGTNTLCYVLSPYSDVIIAAGTGMLVGAPLFTPTLSFYFWAQSWGPIGIVSGGAIVRGDDILSNDDGTVIADDAAAVQPRVGIAMNTFDSGDAGPVFLQICP